MAKDSDKDIEDAKRVMAALVRMPPKPHDEMKPRRKAESVSIKRKNVKSAKPSSGRDSQKETFPVSKRKRKVKLVLAPRDPDAADIAAMFEALTGKKTTTAELAEVEAILAEPDPAEAGEHSIPIPGKKSWGSD